jgi:hypothetical protein
MSGKRAGWSEIGGKFSPAMTPTELKSRLNQIVARRNQIVHEGDYVRLDRPQNAKMNGLDLPEASQMVDFMEQLIDAMHDVV